ncbi:hypothetical protein E2C01_044678 [Portunus trituberculatus]|uniref:Uncharacterized protein n=1 Tax=Portunus trituberculatus TaxID=210409 RepID=A0A5B7G2Y8_PORTR|nr:hypothetical protein [Portunus trituberculatus]
MEAKENDDEKQKEEREKDGVTYQPLPFFLYTPISFTLSKHSFLPSPLLSVPSFFRILLSPLFSCLPLYPPPYLSKPSSSRPPPPSRSTDEGLCAASAPDVSRSDTATPPLIFPPPKPHNSAASLKFTKDSSLTQALLLPGRGAGTGKDEREGCGCGEKSRVHQILS